MIIDRFYTILHQLTVPYTHIDRSSEETAMPDFAEDDVNDLRLLELLLTLPDNSIFPFHHNSLITTPSFEIPFDVAVDVAADVAVDVDVGVDVAVGTLSTRPPR
jgi:hypothetical protein